MSVSDRVSIVGGLRRWRRSQSRPAIEIAFSHVGTVSIIVAVDSQSTSSASNRSAQRILVRRSTTCGALLRSIFAQPARLRTVVLEHEYVDVVVPVGALDAIPLAHDVLAALHILGRAVVVVVLTFGVDGMGGRWTDGESRCCRRSSSRGGQIDQSTCFGKPTLAVGWIARHCCCWYVAYVELKVEARQKPMSSKTLVSFCYLSQH